MHRPSGILLLVVLLLQAAGCTPRDRVAEATPVPATPQRPLDVEALRRALHMDGTVQDGRLKVTIPQNDLDVAVDGFKIIPPMGLGSWAVFAPADSGAVVMGDFVVREEEVAPVEQAVLSHGLTVTALHKHFLHEEPRVNFMHVGGTGSEAALAKGLRAVLDTIAVLRGSDPATAKAATVPNTLDTTHIAGVLGYSGKMTNGVYKVVVARPDVEVTNRGVPVTAFMGFNTWASWQGTDEQAAVAGDFAMLEDEVTPVLRALASHGIQVIALHNHMVHESPRVFFLHYWGTGPADSLARGLRDALDQTRAP